MFNKIFLPEMKSDHKAKIYDGTHERAENRDSTPAKTIPHFRVARFVSF